MSILTSHDLTKILFAIELLNSETGYDSLPDRTLKSVQSLIPNEMTAFDGFDIEAEYSGSYWYSPAETVPDERIKLFGELIQEHPVSKDVLDGLKEKTYLTSRYLPLREFHKTILYNEFYRFLGGDAQMGTAMRVSPTCYITCNVLRPRMDFTEREFEMLRLLTPHLKAAFRNAQALDQLSRIKRYLSAAVTKDIVVLDVEGQVAFQTERATDLLLKYFDNLAPNGLPFDLISIIHTQSSVAEGEEFYQPPDPITIKKNEDQLKVSLIFDSSNTEITLLLEERTEHCPLDFADLGLTARESEVMFWISRGKTDGEIAHLLSVSPRTVQKHTENIFTKFGVETRTAAAMLATERIILARD